MKKSTITIIIILLGIPGLVWWASTRQADVLEQEPVVENGDEEEVVDTSDWQTYRNEEYGYEVSYPNEWLGGETDPTTDYAVFFREAKDSEDQMRAVLAIQVFDSDGLTALEWWNVRDENDGAVYASDGQGRVDDILVYKFREEGGLDSAYAVFKKDENIFLVSRIGLNDEIFSAFLHSLTFWQTYRNEEYGFEIQYPEGWDYVDRTGYDPTPFSVSFSDDPYFVERAGGTLAPGVYPDRLFSLVLYQGPETIDQYVARDAENAITSNIQEVSISGREGILLEKTYHDNNINKDKESIAAYMREGDHIFIFTSISDADGDVEEMKNNFEAMLSSFMHRSS